MRGARLDDIKKVTNVIRQQVEFEVVIYFNWFCFKTRIQRI